MVLKKTIRFLSAVFASVALMACNSVIYDYDDKCVEGLELRFVYDYNLEWANAFPSKVDCLTVLIYDAAGHFVERRSEKGEALKDPDYRMTFELPEGHYQVAAYGGMECEDASFSFDNDPASVSASQRSVSMRASGTNVSGALLHDHYHGMLDVNVKGADLTYTLGTVEMMKNTNNFRIILKNLNGESLHHSQFDMNIIDDNTHFAHDNSIIPSQPITYKAWTTGEVSDGLNSNGEEWNNVYGELSTSRLIVRTNGKSKGGGAPSGSSVVDSPRLLINNNNSNEPSVDIPLLNLLMQFKSQRYNNISAQEFLDRKSDWDMMFFLDNKSWVYVNIKVDDWTVRINRADL